MTSLLDNLPIQTVDVSEFEEPCEADGCLPPSFAEIEPLIVLMDDENVLPGDEFAIDIVALGVPICANAVVVQVVARPFAYLEGSNYINVSSNAGAAGIAGPLVTAGLTSRVNFKMGYSADRGEGVLPVDLETDPNIYIRNRASNGGVIMTDVGVGISGYWR